MSNLLPADKLTTLLGLFERGYGIRSSSRIMAISPNTATRYYPRDRIIACACGDPATHRGWCSWRVGQSPERLAFLRRWAYRSSGLLISITGFSIAEQATVVLRPSNIPGEAVTHIDVINAIKTHAPAHLDKTLREDLMQDLFLEVLEARTPLSELGAAVKRRLSEISGQVSRFKFVSLDADIPGTDGLRMVDTIESDRFHF